MRLDHLYSIIPSPQKSGCLACLREKVVVVGECLGQLFKEIQNSIPRKREGIYIERVHELFFNSIKFKKIWRYLEVGAKFKYKSAAWEKGLDWTFRFGYYIRLKDALLVLLKVCMCLVEGFGIEYVITIITMFICFISR